MHAYYPLLLTGGIIGFISILLIVAYASIKDKKQAIGFDRHMKDGEIIRRLMAYAKPYRGKFLFVGCIMLVGIAYDILSPTIIGRVIAVGSHESLLSTCPAYARLVELQRLEDEAKE